MKEIRKKLSFLIVACSLIQATYANNLIVKEYAYLNYQLESVWDQKDPIYRSEVIDDFTTNIENIKIAYGLSNDEVISLLLEDIKIDPMAKKEIQSFVEYAKQNTLSEVERNTFITSLIQNSQSTGANFDSGSMAGILGLAALVGVIVYFAISTDPGHGPAPDHDDICTDGNPNNNSGSYCDPCSDDDFSNDEENFCSGYTWSCTSSNSYYSYEYMSKFREQAKSGAYSYCLANTPDYDICTFDSCIRI